MIFSTAGASQSRSTFGTTRGLLDRDASHIGDVRLHRASLAQHPRRRFSPADDGFRLLRSLLLQGCTSWVAATATPRPVQIRRCRQNAGADRVDAAVVVGSG